jgi:5-methylcytosine-specific restriction endonuclease McrA
MCDRHRPGYYSDNRERILAQRRKRYAENIEKERQLGRTKYYRRRDKAVKHQRDKYVANRESELKRGKKWRGEHPQEMRAHCRKRHALKLGASGTHSAKEWEELKEFFGNKCLCCGITGVALTEDHIVPLTKGGNDGIDNIQPLCGPCNSKKKQRTVDYR